jgi:hypothetical protein
LSLEVYTKSCHTNSVLVGIGLLKCLPSWSSNQTLIKFHRNWITVKGKHLTQNLPLSKFSSVIYFKAFFVAIYKNLKGIII